MVDPGETVSTTVKREFMEEAMDTTGERSNSVDEIDQMVSSFFANGQEIYSGYVDDPRNTDNAWMETVAFLFHDDTEVSRKSDITLYCCNSFSMLTCTKFIFL